MIILWYKAFHVFFMVAWFAGIFYLPRLFVYHAENEATADPKDTIKSGSNDQTGIATTQITNESIVHTSETLKVMERRLLYFVTPFAIFTLIFGLLLIHSYGMEWFKVSHWLHAKLLLVALLYIYHGYCFVLLKRFKDNKNDKSARFFRIFNEVPVLILLAIIILAIVKPF